MNESIRVAWRNTIADTWQPLEVPADIRFRLRWDEPIYSDVVRSGGRVAVWERDDLVYFAAHAPDDDRARA